MLKNLSNSFYKSSSCTESIDSTFFTERNISCFDNDGFELSLLEQYFYQLHNFALSNDLNHNCLQAKWLELNDEYFLLDHSLLLERKNFEGKAREQIQFYSKKYPQLLKYLNLKPKWGIDFALEYYKDDEYYEVLHIEYDYDNYYQAVEEKEKFQTKLLHTDWNDFLSTLKKKKEEWVNLKGFQQNDYKARLWGLPKAEDTLKSFV